MHSITILPRSRRVLHVIHHVPHNGFRPTRHGLFYARVIRCGGTRCFLYLHGSFTYQHISPGPCSRVVFTLTSISSSSHAFLYVYNSSVREKDRWLTRVTIYREQNNKGVMVYVAMLSTYFFPFCMFA